MSFNSFFRGSLAEPYSDNSSSKDPQKSELKDIYNDWKAWCAKDNKAVGILMMKMKSELQTFIKYSARETWSTLQESFGKSGLPGIFADYKLFKNWQLNINDDPTISISEMEIITNHLKAAKYNIQEPMIVMTLLDQLLNNNDGAEMRLSE